MDPQILLIKMSEEAKQWDEMVDRVDDYLIVRRDQKLQQRETMLKQDQIIRGITRQKTKKEKTHGIQTKSLTEQKRETEMKQKYMGKSEGARVFEEEELELIACAFKSQLQEDRKSIKDIDILMKKGKFETKKNVLDLYKNGLRQNMISHA